MWIGISFGFLACALWGSVYLLPLILSSYDPVYITLMRAIIMGAASVIGILSQRHLLSRLTKADWRFAFVLTMIGNVIQCWMMMLSVQFSSPVVAGVCFGLVPVLVAVIANERDRRQGKVSLPLKKLFIPLLGLFTGLLCANWGELTAALNTGNHPERFALGVFFGLVSTAMWTWYPIRNADWLLEHRNVSPIFWTSVQCVILLPVGCLLWIITWLLKADMPSIIGTEPLKFFWVMLFAGVVCSWGATALWNAMSQRVPTSLVGQMLVFETIFSVLFGLLWNMRLPDVNLVIGLVLMVASISYSLRLFDRLRNKTS